MEQRKIETTKKTVNVAISNISFGGSSLGVNDSKAATPVSPRHGSSSSKTQHSTKRHAAAGSGAGGRDGSKQQISSPRSLSHALKKAANGSVHALHSAAGGGDDRSSSFTIEPVSSNLPKPSSLSTGVSVPEALAELASKTLPPRLPLTKSELRFAPFYDHSEGEDGKCTAYACAHACADICIGAVFPCGACVLQLPRSASS